MSIARVTELSAISEQGFEDAINDTDLGTPETR